MKMGSEFVAAKEGLALLKRDSSKYMLNVVGMYVLSMKGWESAHIFRSAYYAVRHFDDVLDGDRQVSCQPMDYINALRSQIETGRFEKGLGIAVLAKHAIEHLEKRSKSGDDPRSDFLRAIDGIIYDYERSQEKRVLTREGLEDYYFKAFDPVVNIALMCVNSSLRSRDIPIMSYGQGRVYSVRDLRDDWERGTINIPDAILGKAGLTVDSKIEAVQKSTVVKAWFDLVLSDTKPALIELQQRFRETREVITNFALGRKITPMVKFIDQYTG